MAPKPLQLKCVDGEKVSKLENKMCPRTSTFIKESYSGLYNKSKPSTRHLGNLEFFFPAGGFIIFH